MTQSVFDCISQLGILPDLVEFVGRQFVEPPIESGFVFKTNVTKRPSRRQHVFYEVLPLF